MLRSLTRLIAIAPDVCMTAGVCLVGIGVYRWWPLATWFFAGGALMALGWLLSRAERT